METKARDAAFGPGLWTAVVGLASICCLLLVGLGLYVSRQLAEAEDLHQKQDGLPRIRILDERPKQPGGVKW